MKKKLLISGAIVVVLVVGLLAWYFLSSSATEEQLRTELEKMPVNATSTDGFRYKRGSCFDTCASAVIDATIPETSEYALLFQAYKQRLTQNGYTVTTTEDEFLATTYPNGNPSSVYLVLYAEGSNKYDLMLGFNNSVTDEPNRIRPNGQPVGSVDQVSIILNSTTR